MSGRKGIIHLLSGDKESKGVVSMMNIYQGELKHKLSGEEAKEGVSTMNADKRGGKSTAWI